MDLLWVTISLSPWKRLVTDVLSADATFCRVSGCRESNESKMREVRAAEGKEIS